MKFRFVWVGKTRDKNYKALQDDYLKRLSHFVRYEIVEVPDGPRPENEGKQILAKLGKAPMTCLLDVDGRSLTSPELAKTLEKWQNAGIKEVAFVVGGADGVTPEVAARADLRLSLSFLTFTHEMARVVMLEQLYRAFTMIKGFPYQK